MNGLLGTWVLGLLGNWLIGSCALVHLAPGLLMSDFQLDKKGFKKSYKSYRFSVNIGIP
jgi:hypothetical protein